MKRRLFRTSIVAALCTAMLLGLAGPAGAYSNNFDSDTAGWFDNGRHDHPAAVRLRQPGDLCRRHRLRQRRLPRQIGPRSVRV